MENNTANAGDEKSEDYIQLEKRTDASPLSRYEDLHRTTESSASHPPFYEVTINREQQKQVESSGVWTRNLKGVDNNAYCDPGFQLKNRTLPDVPQSYPSVQEDEEDNYIVPESTNTVESVFLENDHNLTQPEAMTITEFQTFMSRRKEEVAKDISQQFMLLPSGGQYSSSVALEFQNKPRNFFRSFLPYDHSRVKLDTSDSDARSDYINASYLKNYEGKTSFIAAQGPQESTVDDFWKMVWQEDVNTIVMVTDSTEQNKLPCSLYWPRKVHSSEVFGDITVLLVKSISYKTHTIRKLNLLKGNRKPEVHLVTQVQLHNWSDGGIPKEPTSLRSVIKKVKLWETDECSSPLLVHCGNGVGATGTFIAVYCLMDIAKKHKEINIFQLVEQMRKDRMDMVQTRIQYRFIFESVLAALQTMDSCLLDDELQKLSHPSIKRKSKDEFKVLQGRYANVQPKDVQVGTAHENQHKNRFTTIIPEEAHRPVLKSEGKTNGCNSYINAFHVMDFGGTEFIMTQSPLVSTVEDFWRLVYDYQCTTVIMLNKADGSDTSVVQYWPGVDRAHYGYIEVKCKSTTRSESFVYNQFHVAHDKHQKEKFICVDHYAFLGSDGKEPDVSVLRKFITDTPKKGTGPVLVHCINGVGLSGVYIIGKTEIERLESEGTVDVFQSLQRMREECPFTIQTEEEYTLCYQLLKDHLHNSEEYAEVY